MDLQSLVTLLKWEFFFPEEIFVDDYVRKCTVISLYWLYLLIIAILFNFYYFLTQDIIYLFLALKYLFLKWTNAGMHKMAKISQSFFLLFFLLIQIYAQQNTIKFDKIGPIIIPNCIMQDSYGFIWIGAQEGLIRYDGYNFKRYTNIPFDSTSLSNNWVRI